MRVTAAPVFFMLANARSTFSAESVVKLPDFTEGHPLTVKVLQMNLSGDTALIGYPVSRNFQWPQCCSVSQWLNAFFAE